MLGCYLLSTISYLNSLPYILKIIIYYSVHLHYICIWNSIYYLLYYISNYFKFSFKICTMGFLPTIHCIYFLISLPFVFIDLKKTKYKHSRPKIWCRNFLTFGLGKTSILNKNTDISFPSSKSHHMHASINPLLLPHFDPFLRLWCCFNNKK